MPEDVRVASAAVLETIYRDAGLPTRPPATAAGPETAKTTLSAAEIATLSRSPLTALHHRLVTPSAEQQRAQAFSLSADRYGGITAGDGDGDGDDDDHHHHPSADPPASSRRNLGDALAALRGAKPGSAAEVYTRSLMMDAVPTRVVREFARMVAECNPGGARPDGEPMS